MTARKPESTFITSVHRHLPATLYRIKNNNMYNGGQADCWYSGHGGDLWVEYKWLARVPPIIDLVTKPSPKVDPILSKLQQDWLNSRYDEGRKVAVIVGWKDGGVIYTSKSWNNPLKREDFITKCTAKRVDIAQFIQSICL